MEEWKEGGGAGEHHQQNQNPKPKHQTTHNFHNNLFFLPYFIKYMNRDDLWSMYTFFIP